MRTTVIDMDLRFARVMGAHQRDASSQVPRVLLKRAAPPRRRSTRRFPWMTGVVWLMLLGLVAGCQETPTLSDAQRAVLARTAVPALLPASPRLVQAAMLTGERDWFAASIPDDDVVITLEGNLKSMDAPEIKAAFKGYAVGTRAKPRLGHNELVIEAAWLDADGVAWSLEVDCKRPDTNPRCVNNDYILSLVRGLRRVGEVQP